jgi:hypothetical protein
MDSTSTAVQKLEHLARKEVGASLTPIEAPAPPGVGPQALALRPPAETRARLSLAEALGELEPAHAVEPGTGPPDLDSATRDQALRHYARGRDAAISGEQLAAIIELEKALALDPGSPAVLRQLARSYLSMRNNLKATRHYERLLAVEPNDSESLFMLGLTARSRRDFEQAATTIPPPTSWPTSGSGPPCASSATTRLGSSWPRTWSADSDPTSVRPSTWGSTSSFTSGGRRSGGKSATPIAASAGTAAR